MAVVEDRLFHKGVQALTLVHQLAKEVKHPADKRTLDKLRADLFNLVWDWADGEPVYMRLLTSGDTLAGRTDIRGRKK